MRLLTELAHVVAPKVLDDAIQVAGVLTELGVPHVLIGGLAVGRPWLAQELSLPSPGELNVISVEGLIEMKLSANRAQDRADVSQLLEVGASLDRVASYLGDRCPDLLPSLAELAG